VIYLNLFYVVKIIIAPSGIDGLAVKSCAAVQGFRTRVTGLKVQSPIGRLYR